jgi:hypothetical protein
MIKHKKEEIVERLVIPANTKIVRIKERNGNIKEYPMNRKERRRLGIR